MRLTESRVTGAEWLVADVSTDILTPETLSEEHRALFLVQDCKVQAWTTKAGLMTFQVDASRDSVEP